MPRISSTGNSDCFKIRRAWAVEAALAEEEETITTIKDISRRARAQSASRQWGSEKKLQASLAGLRNAEKALNLGNLILRLWHKVDHMFHEKFRNSPLCKSIVNTAKLFYFTQTSSISLILRLIMSMIYVQNDNSRFLRLLINHEFCSPMIPQFNQGIWFNIIVLIFINLFRQEFKLLFGAKETPSTNKVCIAE